MNHHQSFPILWRSFTHRGVSVRTVSAVLENAFRRTAMSTLTSKLKPPSHCCALVAICLLGVATAWADPSGTRSTEVSFRDLDLNTQSGAAKLYRRIQGAAQRVCGYEPTLAKAQSIWQHCVLPTVDAAVTKVNNPLLTALHTGRSSPAVTAMTSK